MRLWSSGKDLPLSPLAAICVSLTLPTFSLYLFSDFLPGYILPCHRPKQLYPLTNKNNTYTEGYSITKDGLPEGFHSRLFVYDKYGVLNENGHNGLVYLKTWDLFGGTVWQGLRGLPLLEEVCHWEIALRFQKTHIINNVFISVL